MVEGGRFIADSMLGKLARWMRTLGFDVAYERAIDDAVLVRRAVEEGRTILTRDRLLIRRRLARGRSFLVESDHVDAQLRSVVERFGLPQRGFLTRCLRCNVLLERVGRSEVEAVVPAYVFETCRSFARCPGCGRIYWGATHRERMIEEIERMLGKGAVDF